MTQENQDTSNTPTAKALPNSAGSAFDRIDTYHADCSKMYGPMPTEYQRGVLQGLECARSLTARERDEQNH